MEKLIDEFIDYLKNIRNYSLLTCKNYYKDLMEYQNFLNIENIKYSDMNYDLSLNYLIFLNNKKNSKATISRKLSSLRSFYKYLVKMNKVKTNPFLLVSSPKKEKKNT